MARGAHTDYEQLPSGTAPDVIMNKIVVVVIFPSWKFIHFVIILTIFIAKLHGLTEKSDRQYNGKNKKDKRRNNDIYKSLHNKLNIEQHEPLVGTQVLRKGKQFLAPLAPVVLLLLQSR